MNNLLELTAELINRPSVSFEEGPFVDWLQEELADLDHLETIRIGDNLIARTNFGHPERIVLAGHSDTVPVNGNDVARIDGDVCWGLGASDMKSGLAVFLELARTVKNPTKDVTYVFYAREEVAAEHNGLNEVIAEQPELLEGDCAVLGEPTAAAIEAGCQGTLSFLITLKGAQAHTARPWMGRNAVHRLAPILFELEAFKVRTPTINDCTFCESIQAVHVEGGVASNVVPDEAKVRFHYRYAPDRNPAQAKKFVTDLLAPYLEPADDVEIVDGSPACMPSSEHPLLKQLAEDNDLEVRAKLGWTDVARFVGLGIPAINFGPGDALVAHTADEHVERGAIEKTYNALHALITT